MMKVTVLFFGQTAEIAGKREVEMLFAESTAANVAFAKIVEQYPKLSENKLLFAVNQTYANGTEIINHGDELAVFTAVSGG
jgi:sulfur-carrier protein